MITVLSHSSSLSSLICCSWYMPNVVDTHTTANTHNGPNFNVVVIPPISSCIFNQAPSYPYFSDLINPHEIEPILNFFFALIHVTLPSPICGVAVRSVTCCCCFFYFVNSSLPFAVPFVAVSVHRYYPFYLVFEAKPLLLCGPFVVVEFSRNIGRSRSVHANGVFNSHVMQRRRFLSFICSTFRYGE